MLGRPCVFVSTIIYRIFAEWHNPASLSVMKMWLFKRLICFHKCTHVFIMYGKSTAAKDPIFSADNVIISALQADGNSQAISSFDKDPVSLST